MIETTWDGLAVARDKPYGASILVWRRARGGPRVAGSPSRSSRARLRRGLGLDATGRRASARRGSPPLCRARTPRGDGPHAPTDRDDLGSDEWPLFVAEAPPDAEVRLDDEHDRYECCRLTMQQRVASLRSSARASAPSRRRSRRSRESALELHAQWPRRRT